MNGEDGGAGDGCDGGVFGNGGFGDWLNVRRGCGVTGDGAGNGGGGRGFKYRLLDRGLGNGGPLARPCCCLFGHHCCGTTVGIAPSGL